MHQLKVFALHLICEKGYGCFVALKAHITILLIVIHVDFLPRSLVLYSSTYENYVVIGDFNVEVGDIAMSDFCNTFNLACLIIEPTCCNNPEKPSCIDLILTNKPHNF